MEIQQKENKILVAYIHHVKTETKSCDFNKATAVICIFVKVLKDAHNVAGKVNEKDPQILSEVIQLVEKINTAQQGMATLPSPQ